MTQTLVQVDVVIIGAGVVGLSVAQLLAQKYQVAVVEKNNRFGEETSSRNSEVIHSGIYYDFKSNKSNYCLRGRELLYDFCKKYQVPFLNCGKYIVATENAHLDKLENLKERARTVGVNCNEVSSGKLAGIEPQVKAQAALFISSSGIVDSHGLMAALEKLYLEKKGILAYQHKVSNIERDSSHWILEYQASDGSSGKIQSPWVINCAGLGAAELSNQALNQNRFQHRFCRGRYLNLSSKFQNAFHSLIYPIPEKDGLGIHVTRDMSGMIRLGPDVEWSGLSSYNQVNELYQCDWESVFSLFLKSVNCYFPKLKIQDLGPGTIGVRPKLFIDGEATRDFVLQNNKGWIDLLGIESPGLTASLALAEAVRDLM